MTKNPAAVALGKRRAKGADMAAVGKLGGIAARGKSGRPMEATRCACGEMSAKRAQQRGHRCPTEQ